jgi:hypothetical protein
MAVQAGVGRNHRWRDRAARRNGYQIMRQTHQSKPTDLAVATTLHGGGMPRGTTHPPSRTSLAAAVIDQMLTKTMTESLADVMH